MNSSVGSEIVTGFIEEVEGYLPDMSRCLQILQQNRAHKSSLAELHRITHTIKGAAAMVGLDDLSSVGEILERMMESVLAASLVLDDETLDLLGDAQDRIDKYCMMQRNGRPDAGNLFQNTVAEIEKKLQSSPDRTDKDQGGIEERHNPEAIFFPQETAAGKVSDDHFDVFEKNKTGTESIFAQEFSSDLLDDDDRDNELLFQDAEDSEDEEDDLFDSNIPEPSALSEKEESGQNDSETEAVEAIDPELLQCFSEETEEHLENIDSCLNELGSRISTSVELTPSTQETLHSLRRSVHTLKGAAAVIGIEQVAAWGHDFEDFLDWLHDEAGKLDPAAVAVLREGADLLASLAEEPTLPAEKKKQCISAKFSEISKAFSSAPASGTDSDSSALFEPAEKDSVLGRDNAPERTTDLFAEEDTEETEAAEDGAAESFFDDFFSSDSSSEDDGADELFSQDAEDDVEDLFGSDDAEPLQFSEAEVAYSAEPEATAAIDPELLQCFNEETEEHLENIDSCLNELGTRISTSVELTPSMQETLHSLRRSVHTLKGAAAVIGIEQVAAWGHDFEDFLDWLHDEAGRLDPAVVSLLRDGADVLADLADNPSCPVEKRKKALTTAFQQILAKNERQGKTPSVDQNFFPDEEYAAEKVQVGAGEVKDGEEPDNFFNELPDDTPDRPEIKQVLSQKVDPELLQCFHEEAEEHLDSLDRQLNHLGVTVSGETVLTDFGRGSLHSIRRSVHTLKGAAAVIGIEQIAAWGHDFEDFLDWLHDEAQVIHPVVITAMQEGADILVRLVEDPGSSVQIDQQKLLEKFEDITTGSLGKISSSEITAARDTDSDTVDSDTSESGKAVSEEQEKTAPAARQSQRKKTATLRVDVERIDQMVGLSGDMVINLSSFEDSMKAMSGTMNELDMILQRLKNINSSLEAGYELASIPHLGSPDLTNHSGLTEDFDPLEMDRYSELNILIRSLSEAVSDLDSIMGQNVLDNVTWQKNVERQGMVMKELQNRMMGIRMTPLSTLSSRMHRTVREAERTTGHPARLSIEGESMMMDTRVWDVMADPLMHILRNAVAHGGSLPGKAAWEPLSITIKAVRKGGLCTLRVSDNGKGLDYEAICVKGMKLYPNDRVNLMTKSELAELIFRHGFSSTDSVSNIAGRGVGMDVVRDAVDQLNGSIELISEQGQGTEFIMRLPVSVAQLPAILARFGTQIYAVPMHDIAGVHRAAPKEKQGSEYSFDGETLPLLHLSEMPGFETGYGYFGENLTESDQAVLIVHTGRKRAAVLCEQLLGQRDIVFKDLGTHLSNVPCISGVTIMGDGSLIPILQMEELLAKWASASGRQEVRFTDQTVQERGPLRILIVDDSISVRKVVSNFITQQGWMPVTARNGIEAVEKIREERPDFVLLDVEMPRMNGFEVLQALQAQPELRDIPVAMLTSRSATKYQEKAKDLGARGFMTKPFKEDEVVAFIREATAVEQV